MTQGPEYAASAAGSLDVAPPGDPGQHSLGGFFPDLEDLQQFTPGFGEDRFLRQLAQHHDRLLNLVCVGRAAVASREMLFEEHLRPGQQGMFKVVGH